MTTIENSGAVSSTEPAIGLFAIPTDNPGLMQSQVNALSRRIPLLYFIVFVNTTAVAWTHYGIAPDVLTIGFPAIVLIAGLMRARAWVKSRGRAISAVGARRLLIATVVVAGVLGATFLVWGLALYQYGDAYEQGHVVFYMAITLICAVFCLMPLRSAALLLTAVTVIPFSIFFLAAGRPVFIAIAVNMLLVSAAMVYVLITYSRDFANMVVFQERLVETHKAETERVRLANEVERAAQREILETGRTLRGRTQQHVAGPLHVRCRRSPDRLQSTLRENVCFAGRVDAAGRELAGHCRPSGEDVRLPRPRL